jgi:far upstream element-binding protein
MQIESSLVGLIIGRQGENLRRVEADSQCRVQFVPATNPGDQFRLCKITGAPASRAEAKAAINRIIEDSGMSAIARGGAPPPRGGRDSGRGGGGDSGQTPALKEGEDLVQIMVPDRTVGLIIGRGGETIRDLQERSGCHVNIVGENKSVNGLRPVNLIGTPPATKMAKDLIMEIVDSDSRNAAAGGHDQRPPRRDMREGGGGPGGADKQTDSIYVPSEAVGMIIGKGGEAIREMQSTTGCKINVSQSSGPGETEREIGLVGSIDAINRAKQAIEEKVEASVSQSHWTHANLSFATLTPAAAQ